MTDDEYREGLAEVERLFEDDQHERGSPEFERFWDLIDALVEYENEHFPIEPPTVEQAALFRREQEQD